MTDANPEIPWQQTAPFAVALRPRATLPYCGSAAFLLAIGGET